MNLYLDDCMDDNELAQRLRQAGHTVVSPREASTVGMADRGHLGYAAQHHYTLLTKNCDDFQELHRHWQRIGHTHNGILLVCQDNNANKDMTLMDIVRAIGHLVMAALPVTDELHILNHWR
jgi:hypothetical protein